MTGFMPEVGQKDIKFWCIKVRKHKHNYICTTGVRHIRVGTLQILMLNSAFVVR